MIMKWLKQERLLSTLKKSFAHRMKIQTELKKSRNYCQPYSRGAIRFGFKKNRGLGRLRINKVYKWEFALGKESAEDWVCYCSETEEERRRKRPGCLWKDWENRRSAHKNMFPLLYR